MDWFTNRNLIVFQAQLFNSSYSGPGKWVLFNPENRRAFLAVGKDRLPPVVHLLAGVRWRASVRDEAHPYGPAVAADLEAQLPELARAGLLRSIRETESTTLEGYLPRYHRSVFDFPFLNYTGTKWLEDDRALMQHYAQLWPHPPMKTPRDGPAYRLPSVTAADLLGPAEPTSDLALPLRCLAAILRFTFAPILELEGATGSFIRKTSPSGGDLHPTEGIIILPSALNGIPAGVYAYDVERHGLISVLEDYPDLSPIKRDSPIFGILLRSRVERPMWRYRDPRSFRAVLIDAGHVAENLTLLLANFGYATRISPPPRAVSRPFAWVSEPEVALLLAGPSDELATIDCPRIRPWQLQHHDHSNRHLTNPSLFMTFGDGALVGHVLWPELRTVKVEFADFDVLTHCLPSRRGDRLTTMSGILAAVPSASVQQVELLCDAHALLPEEIGRDFYAALDLWVRHGWYMPFLAHLNVQSAEKISATSNIQTVPFSTGDLVRALLLRKTTRSFASKSVALSCLTALLREATPVVKEIDDCERPVSVFVVALAVDGLASGLYRWDSHNLTLHALNRKITRWDLRNMATGQPWAGAGAAVILILRRMDLLMPARYELELLDLGRIGQRVCLAGAARGLGVFVTPALLDSSVLSALAVPQSTDFVEYFVAVGHPKEAYVEHF
jgi:SagB-type dehydrogenase family enzyme